MPSKLSSRIIALGLCSLVLIGAVTVVTHAADQDKKAATTAPSAPGPLGDLSAFRDITQDTLRLAKAGDLPGAKKRVTDLETAWDKAEEKLRARDEQKWTAVDKAIDQALKELRSSPPVAAKCIDALEKLIAKIDSISPK